jgi:type III restriction enzyme
VRKLAKGDNLFSRLSNELDQYRGYVVSDINANTDTLSFTNGWNCSSARLTVM